MSESASPRKIFRQGDVLLRNIGAYHQSLPPGLKDNEVPVIVGEPTGRAHIIRGPGVKWTRQNDRRELLVPVRASLIHSEHAPILLPSGRYEVRRQREWHVGSRDETGNFHANGIPYDVQD